jgi:serine protease AprX
MPKITPKLQERLNSIGDNERVDAEVWFNDIDFEKVKEVLKTNIPHLVDNDGQFIGQSMDEVHRYNEEKRNAAKNLYLTNNAVILRTFPSDTNVIFNSKYAPFAILNTSKSRVSNLEQNTTVQYIELFENNPLQDEAHESDKSMRNIRAHYTRNTIGLMGTGVKVGQIESSNPDKEDLELAHLTITTNDSLLAYSPDVHATRVAIILAGKSNGVAPDVSYFSTRATNEAEFYSGMEWLADQGVNVTNMSAGLSASTSCGYYTSMDKWVDHLAMNHSMHFVKSAGNQTCGLYITTPGMAYNGVTVGAIHKNTEPDTGEPYWADDQFADNYSSWAQHEAGHKPNVTAPGTTDWLNADRTALDAGTSYSAPHVAGVVDARWSYYIVNNSRYKTVKLFQADFPYTTTFYVGSSDTLIRVAIHWLKQNQATTTTHGGEDISDPPLSNLNLYVDANGNLIGSSRSSNSNIEVVELAPKTTGYHKLRIEAASISNDYEYVGIAWW